MPHIGLKVTAAVAILAGSAGIGEPSSKKSFTMHCGELHGMRASMGDLGKQSRGQGVIWKRDGYDGQTTTVSWTPNDPDTLLFVLGGDRPTKTTIEAHVLYNDGHAIFAINKCRRAGACDKPELYAVYPKLGLYMTSMVYKIDFGTHRDEFLAIASAFTARCTVQE